MYNDYSIEIDSNLLSDITSKLEQDNANIMTIIRYCYNAYKTLTEDKWQSVEKDAMDSDFIAYMERIIPNTEEELKKCTDFLRNVIRLHESHEDMLKTAIDESNLGQNLADL